jgi:hypothetical protein
MIWNVARLAHPDPGYLPGDKQALRRPAPYVVTDCDVDLACTSPHAIAIYLTLLRLIPQAACVGPMLRIEDIPQSYPLFARVMNLHIAQF